MDTKCILLRNDLEVIILTLRNMFSYNATHIHIYYMADWPAMKRSM